MCVKAIVYIPNASVRVKTPLFRCVIRRVVLARGRKVCVKAIVRGNDKGEEWAERLTERELNRKETDQEE